MAIVTIGGSAAVAPLRHQERGSGASLYIYSRQSGTSTLLYNFSSTSVSFGLTALYSVSYSSVSRTVSQTVTLGGHRIQAQQLVLRCLLHFRATATANTWSSQVMHV
jgi:hypothetical protein